VVAGREEAREGGRGAATLAVFMSRGEWGLSTSSGALPCLLAWRS